MFKKTYVSRTPGAAGVDEEALLAACSTTTGAYVETWGGGFGEHREGLITYRILAHRARLTGAETPNM